MEDMTSIARMDLMDDDICLTPHEEMVANSIGIHIMGEVLLYLQNENTIPAIIRNTETKAIEALSEIAQVLNSSSYNDRECLYQIGAIMSILAGLGIYTCRHDE